MKKVVILIVSLLVFNNGYSQEYSNNSLLGSVGISIRDDLNTDGVAINFGFGYQKDIWKNRLRLVPSLVTGNYISLGEDIRDSYFQSTSLRVNLNFDVVKIKSFSVFIGTGIAGNYSSGLVSGRGYFNDTYFAYNGMLGFRVNSIENKFGYELKLFDFSISPPDGVKFAEIAIFQFRLLYKL